MNFSVGENRIFSIHQLVEQNTKGICIENDISAVRIFFEPTVVKVRHVCSISQNFKDLAIDWYGFSYFRNSIFNKNVLDMKHINGLES